MTDRKEQWQRIEQICQAALDRPVGDRAAFLREVCGDDEALRLEVQGLLAAESAADVFLTDSVGAVVAQSLSPSRALTGQRLNGLEVGRLLGAGGMGEVYRARDSRLKRDVALKLLPESVSHDPERLARFRREAQILARLNHSNIAQIYGLEESNGVVALVLELVEGPTLADRIAKGPIPLDEALPIAKQIAEALEIAHEHGIIHRDLKPANIKVRDDGTVKVLDFGLAKAMEPIASSGESAAALTNSPTITSPAVTTGVGVLLGTAAYMSPEQVKGRPADKRSDIWAFGCVLYEVLTGRRPFDGNDVGEVLASVIKDEPKWDDIPTSMQPLLQRCLEKDSKRRLHDISGAELLMETTTSPNDHSHGRGTQVLRLMIEVALVAALITVWLLRQPSPSDAHLLRLDLNLGPNVSLGSKRGTDVVISPDGTRLAFVARSHLFTRRLDQAESVELPGTAEAFAPFFSPDGRWVGFFSAGKLKKIPVTGGSITTLADGVGFGASWGTDDTILASLDGLVLSRVPDAGGPPSRLTTLSTGETGHRWPQILPGGKAVLYTVRRGSAIEENDVFAMRLDTGVNKLLYKGGLFGRYVAGRGGNGYLVFLSNQDTLMAAPFDIARLEIRGTPAPVLDDTVGFSNQSAYGSAQFDASLSGTLVYRPGGQAADIVRLAWLDASHPPQPLSVKPDAYVHPRLSPDGKRIAVAITSSSGQDIWVYDWMRDVRQQLTFGGRSYQFPVWSPDGQYIVFSTGIGGGMMWTRADGAGRPEELTNSQNGQFPWSFSPDGKRIAFAEFPRGNGEIWTVPVNYTDGRLKAGEPQLFVKTTAYDLYPAFSPDGRWIAYRSVDSGRSDIYVRAFPDNGGKWLISTAGGGTVPIWSPNGRELFYRTEDQRIMVASYTANNGAFFPDGPRQWSATQLAEASQRNLDLAPDGKMFIALVPAAASDAQTSYNHVVFLMNFADEIGRRIGDSH